MNDLKERIRAVMAAVFEIDPSVINDDATPGVIERWDSLRHMNLVLALEDEFGIRFPDEMIAQIISFKLIELSLKELGAATP